MDNKQSQQPNCHDFHLNNCRKEDCQFKHTQKMLMKCIYLTNDRHCRFNCQQGICCHDYHLGNCKKGKCCQFSHAGTPLGQCILEYNNYPCFQCQNQNQVTDNSSIVAADQQNDEESIHQIKRQYKKFLDNFQEDSQNQNNQIQRGNREKPQLNQETQHITSTSGQLICLKLENYNPNYNANEDSDNPPYSCKLCNRRICHHHFLTGNLCVKCPYQYYHVQTPLKMCIFKNSKEGCQYCEVNKKFIPNNKVCHSYQLSGICDRGVNCKMAHSDPPLLACHYLESLSKDIPDQSRCKFCQKEICHNHFLTGFCLNPSKCQYYHVKEPKNFCYKRNKGLQCKFCGTKDQMINITDISESDQNHNQSSEIKPICEDISFQRQYLYEKMNEINLQELKNYEKVIKEIKRQVLFRKTITELQKSSRVDAQIDSVDIMFIVDCTSSMDPWISAVKNYITDIIDFQNNNISSKSQKKCFFESQIIEQNSEINGEYQEEFNQIENKLFVNRRNLQNVNSYNNIQFRLSFVGFRDYTDSQVEYLDFTEDIGEFKRHLNKITAEGGSDICEDHFTGLQISTKMSWNSQCKIAILITDSPCHGMKYHDLKEKYDDYPLGDKFNRSIEEYIQYLAQIDVDLYLLKLNEKCDKMFGIIQEVYQNQSRNKQIQYLDIQKPDVKLLKLLQKSVQDSISQSKISIKSRLDTEEITSNKMRLFDSDDAENIIDQINQEEEEEDFYLNQEKLFKFKDIERGVQFQENWNNYYQQRQENVFFVNCYIRFQVSELNSAIIDWRNLKIHREEVNKEYTIYRNNDYFDEDENFTFMKGYDATLNKPLIIYRPRQPVNNEQSMMICMKNKAIANYILKKYQKIFLKLYPQRSNDIALLPSNFDIFLFKSGITYFLAQFAPNISDQAQLNEVSNLKLSTEVISSIIHFSFHYTRGRYILLRNQNSSIQIFDVISNDEINNAQEINQRNNNRSKKKTSQQKIISFFQQHQCNEYCKSLQLIHPFHIDEKFVANYCRNNLNYEGSIYQFYGNFGTKTDVQQNIELKIFCQLCHKFTTKSVKEQDKNQQQCIDCERLTTQNILKEICSNCKKESFIIPTYWIKMIRGNIPKQCRNCIQLLSLKEIVENYQYDSN